MLQTYQAQLNGTQLIWIDRPPAHNDHRRVVVVMEDVKSASFKAAATERLAAFLSARGCLSRNEPSGSTKREDILIQLDKLRDDWSRNPSGSSNSSH